MAIKREFRDAKEHLHYVSSLINSPFKGLAYFPYALTLGIASSITPSETLEAVLALSSLVIYFFALRWQFRYARYIGHKVGAIISGASAAGILVLACPRAINLYQILSQL